MKLTPDELLQVKLYLYGLPRYRETVQELKDHVLTALEAKPNEVFDIKLVNDILLEDFGGADCIKQQEEIYQRDVTKRYFKLLTGEMLDVFRWPGQLDLLPHLALCAILYFAHKQLTVYDSSPMVKAMYLMLYIPGLFFLYRKFVADRLKKTSIIDDFLHKTWMFSVLFGTLILKGISYAHSHYEYSNKTQLLLFLFVFMVESVFIKAYRKVYRDKIRVLAV
jgi:hypothetical protein